MYIDNTTWLLTRWMERLAIPVTRQSISRVLEKHSDHGTMLAFSDTLDTFNVPNSAYQIEADKLGEVPVPYMAQLKTGFVLVEHFGPEKVRVRQDRRKSYISVENFNGLFSGMVLLAEKDERSGELFYAKKILRQRLYDLRLPVFFSISTILFVTFILLRTPFLASLTPSVGWLVLFKSAGLIVAMLLLIQSMDADNPLIQRLCGDDKKGCTRILSSKAAMINEYLNWSEVGFFYFAGTWLLLLFNSSNAEIMSVTGVLNMLCLPYTIYSIYYQWRVAKQWCRFCCIVQGLFWLEFFTFLPYLESGIAMPGVAELLVVAVSMLTPVLIWMLIKPYLLQVQQIAPLKEQLRVFKYNKDVFNKLLDDEIQYDLLAPKDSIIIGSLNAQHTITVVSNPYCQPCANVHAELNEWIPERADIKLQIIFSNSANNKDIKTIVATHIMRIQLDGNTKLVKKALDDWFDQKQKNYEDWIKHYPEFNKIDVSEQLNMQREWNTMVGITGTPTLFINGRRLPNSYRPQDLRYLI